MVWPTFQQKCFFKNWKIVLSLLDLHFRKNHVYNSLFNRNKINCTQNLKSITNNHNMKVLNNTAEIEESWNGTNRKNCLLDGKCLAPNIIYEARNTLNHPNCKENIYTGTAKTNFKHIFNNNTKSFKLKHYKNDTELPKEYWTIKHNHYISKINWRIIRKWAAFHTTKSYKSLHAEEIICWTKHQSLLVSADTKTSLRFYPYSKD